MSTGGAKPSDVRIWQWPLTHGYNLPVQISLFALLLELGYRDVLQCISLAIRCQTRHFRSSSGVANVLIWKLAVVEKWDQVHGIYEQSR